MEDKEGVDKLIELTRIYVDKKGAGRIYIPKEMIEKLSWKNKEKLLVNDKDSMLEIKLAEGD
jgi:bifunctional DNA-binding transcriptional regulator/antitoxin component of YhaV-PrlF toxin-antitoxin module